MHSLLIFLLLISPSLGFRFHETRALKEHARPRSRVRFPMPHLRVLTASTERELLRSRERPIVHAHTPSKGRLRMLQLHASQVLMRTGMLLRYRPNCRLSCSSLPNVANMMASASVRPVGVARTV
jgi:hypothetical protein